MGVLAEAPRTAASQVLALGGAAVGCMTVAVTLAGRVTGLAAHASAERADGLVELAVLAAGVLVLLWLAGSAGVAAACVAARGLGLVWRRGEACVQRFAPSVIRRTLVVVVAAGIGAASVTSASAADLTPTGSPTSATVVAEADGLDLGWVVAAPGDVSTPTAGASAPAVSASGSAAPVATSSTASLEAPSAAASTGADAPSAAKSTATPADMTRPPAGRTPAVGQSAARAPLTGQASTPQASLDGTAAESDALPIPRAPLPTPVPRVVDEEGATVVVVRGDTLWGIAARHLPDGARAAEVAAAWPAWYAANAATIGPDPALIVPGQVLTVPVAVAR